MSLGECKFGFTTGLINTADERLIRGVAAHEIGHEVLGHADKRKTAIAAEQLTRSALSLIPGVGGLIASSAVLVTGKLALPAYSRSQETDADNKAVEILSKANDPDPAGTMAYSFRFLLKSSGATGGGLLDLHPDTRERMETMVKLGNVRTTNALPQATPAAGASNAPGLHAP
jgi:Zn-dependent protease with chaperone function